MPTSDSRPDRSPSHPFRDARSAPLRGGADALAEPSRRLLVVGPTRCIAGRSVPGSGTDPSGVHALLHAAAVRLSAGAVPVSFLRMGRSPLRCGPVHVHPVRSFGLTLSIDRTLRDVVDDGTQVVRFDLQEDVPER